jgi:hypothetical protein
MLREFPLEKPKTYEKKDVINFLICGYIFKTEISQKNNKVYHKIRLFDEPACVESVYNSDGDLLEYAECRNNFLVRKKFRHDGSLLYVKCYLGGKLHGYTFLYRHENALIPYLEIYYENGHKKEFHYNYTY